MLQIIGLMVGLYIILRSLSFLMRSGDRGEHVVVRIYSAIVMIATILLLFALIMSGVDASELTQY